MENNNTGRDIYLHEILIDFLKNTEEYSDERIKEKLTSYYQLQKKKRDNIYMDTTERRELKKLHNFFSKTFNISFSSSNLVYNRFKESYIIAKSAIANLKTAYNNVVYEYYKIANKGYYDYKDPRYLKYLEYIKKKIILAKVNAGLLDYDNMTTKDDLKIEEYKDTFPEDKISNQNNEPSYIKPPESVPFNLSSNNRNGVQTGDRENIRGQINNYNGKDGKVNKEVDDRKGENVDKNKVQTGDRENIRGQINNYNGKDRKVNKEVDDRKGENVDKNKADGQADREDGENVGVLLPPPPFLSSFNIPEIENGFTNIDLGKFLLPPPPLLLGGGAEEKFELPKTLDEQYKEEANYMEKILLDFDVFNDINKNIEIITNKLNEIDSFYKKLDNILKKYDKTEISNTKYEIKKYTDNEKSFEIILKDIKDGNDKAKLFITDKIPNLFKKEKDIYIKNMKDIKKNIYGEKDDKIDKEIDNFINISSGLYKEYIINLKTFYSKFENKEKEIEKNDNKKHELDKLDKGEAYRKGKKSDGGNYNEGDDNSLNNTLLKSLTKLEETKNSISSKITNLKTSFIGIKKELDKLTKDPMTRTALLNSGRGDGSSLFDSIWSKYMIDLKDDNKLIEVTEDKLYENIKNNDIDPHFVLSLTTEDRLIFIVVSYFIRQLSLGIVAYFIEDGKIKDIVYSLVFYVICYTIILIILILIVNFDSYKLRILFNYLNFHINTNGIYMHIFIVCIFTFLIYFLIANINFPIQNINQSYISESDKLKLSYRLDILTMIIYIFSSIIVILI